MGNKHFFRRDLLKASMALAAQGLFPASLKAARPEPTPVSPDLIQAARKEGVTVAWSRGRTALGSLPRPSG